MRRSWGSPFALRLILLLVTVGLFSTAASAGPRRAPARRPAADERLARTREARLVTRPAEGWQERGEVHDLSAHSFAGDAHVPRR